MPQHRSADRGPAGARPGSSPGARPRSNRGNPLDRAGIAYVDYKDTELLRRFVSDRGKIRSRRVTRVTVRQQRQLAGAVKNAREMALLPYPSAAR
ncbi:30S ribosomal protein S18 [Streptomyces sp. MRC013]|uniref:30S ribosomal protein S18 n=1 Tax=Streptomyces sp. MRC013 TaxID=2898276 RepID=UPI002026832B|nr:30S ribosomal protein S18 [Streptomyces sp. MRC013]URM90299.1 30S ribosomal protein S18 [Streptomyces sp. MRC013]